MFDLVNSHFYCPDTHPLGRDRRESSQWSSLALIVAVIGAIAKRVLD
jgi:hypothetical protein